MVTDLGIVLADFNKSIFRVIYNLKVDYVPYRYFHSQAVTCDGKYFL